MSEVVLSDLMRRMLRDPVARQQLSEAIGDNEVSGKVEFEGKVYNVVGEPGAYRECERFEIKPTIELEPVAKAIVVKRLEVPQWAKDAQRKVIDWVKRERSGGDGWDW